MKKLLLNQKNFKKAPNTLFNEFANYNFTLDRECKVSNILYFNTSKLKKDRKLDRHKHSFANRYRLNLRKKLLKERNWVNSENFSLEVKKNYLLIFFQDRNGKLIADQSLFFLHNNTEKDKSYLLRWLILKEKKQLNDLLNQQGRVKPTANRYKLFQKRLAWLDWQIKIVQQITQPTNLVELIGHRTYNPQQQKVPVRGYQYGENHCEKRSVACLLTLKKSTNTNSPNYQRLSGMVGLKTDYYPTLDFDRKNFTDQEWTIFEKKHLLPLIQKCQKQLIYVAKTKNGGYHLVFASKNSEASLAESLFWKRKFRGQLQWKSRYIVLAISQGYQLFHPKEFLHSQGLLKKEPNPTKLPDAKLITLRKLQTKLKQLKISLFKKTKKTFNHPSPPKQPQQRNDYSLNKRKEYTKYTLKEKRPISLNTFYSTLGTIGPPVVPQQKFSQIMQVQLLNYAFVSKLSSFGGSRDSEYYNLLLAVQNQKTLNCLVDSGPSYRQKGFHKIITGQTCQVQITTQTDERGSLANFLTAVY